jgi:hypothetical protein
LYCSWLRSSPSELSDFLTASIPRSTASKRNRNPRSSSGSRSHPSYPGLPPKLRPGWIATSFWTKFVGESDFRSGPGFEIPWKNGGHEAWQEPFGRAPPRDPLSVLVAPRTPASLPRGPPAASLPPGGARENWNPPSQKMFEARMGQEDTSMDRPPIWVLHGEDRF